MRITNGAVIEHEAADGIGQFIIGNSGAGLGRAEGYRHINLAISHQAALCRPVLRKHLAIAPELRMQRIKIGPKPGGLVGKFFCRYRHQQFCRVVDYLIQRLFQEGRAEEIRRLRIGEAAGIAGNPIGERCHG